MHAMIVFLLCELLLTVGGGGATALLTVALSLTNPLFYLLPRLKNKPYEPIGECAYILENGAVVNTNVQKKFDKVSQNIYSFR